MNKGRCKAKYLELFSGLGLMNCRERHMLPSVDHTLAQLTGATIFSKLDVNSGFWQIKLVEELCKLTMYIHNTFWALLFQSSPIWNYLSTKALPKKHVSDPRRTRWCCMHDG